jgi:hypothetical protein
MMADIGILQIATLLATLGGGFAIPFGIKWCGGFVEGKILESEKTAKIAFEASEKSNKVVFDAYSHKVNNTIMRVEGIEREQRANVERIVKLESGFMSLEKGQERIEHALEKQSEDNAKGRSEIIDTIREMSRREIKP